MKCGKAVKGAEVTDQHCEPIEDHRKAFAKFIASEPNLKAKAIWESSAASKIEQVVKHEAGRYNGSGVRWPVARPHFWPGPWAWGCGICSSFLTSLTKLQSKGRDEVASLLKGMSRPSYARLECLSVPKVSNLKEHADNLFHQRAMMFYFNGGIMSLSEIRRDGLDKQIEAGEEVDIAGPSDEEWLQLWQSLRSGVSGRAHAQTLSNDAYATDVKYDGQVYDHHFFSIAIHCFAEHYRRLWRQTMTASDVGMISFDGQGKFEDVHFAVTNAVSLRTTRGLLGICDAHEGEADSVAGLEVNKSIRVSNAIEKELEHFCSERLLDQKRFAYDRGTNKPLLTKCKTDLFQFVCADRAGEAQGAGKIMSATWLTASKFVEADGGHELKTFLGSASKEEPLMKNIHHVLWKKKYAWGKRLRFSAKSRARCKMSFQEIIDTNLAAAAGPDELLAVEQAFEDYNNAPHRWESENTSYEGVTLGWFGLLHNASQDSQSKTMTKEERDAATATCRLMNSEAGVMVAMYGDLQKFVWPTLLKLQYDETDISIHWRLADNLLALLDKAFTQAELLSDAPAYKATLTQIMIRQLRLPMHFVFGEGGGENAIFGWKTNGEAPSWAVEALRRFQKIVSLVKELAQRQQSSGLAPIYRCFDLELWRRASTAEAGDLLMSHFRDLSAALDYPHCPNQFRLVRRLALSQYKSAMKSVTPKQELLASKNSWVTAVLENERIADVSEIKKHVAALCNFQKNNAKRA